MSSNINRVPYLPTTRKFPQDLEELESEISKMYVDVAGAVNSRVIGIFEQYAAITGERWFSVNTQQNVQQKRQTQRQVYHITSGAAFNHGIKVVSLFTRIYGSFTNGTNYYPLPFVDPTAANQIGLVVNATQVVINVGGSAPTISNGVVVLEWLSQ